MWRRADSVMHPWVAFAGLMLLWTEAAVAQARVNGVVGQPVTLPCTYSTARETTSMCWGRGSCPSFQCASPLIRTDGYRVTFQRDRRYTLKGRISQGNVSLTIENAAQSDSGTYCCRVERSGWFNDLKVNMVLDVKPAPPKATRAPTSPKVFTSAPTTAAPTTKLTTAPPKVTSVPTSPRVFTSAPTMPSSTWNLETETASSSPVQTAETQPNTPQGTNTTSSSSHCGPTDGNSTVMQPSEGGWQDTGNRVNLEENPWMSHKALSIGLSTAALMLLSVLAAVVTRKYLCERIKVLHISKLSSNDIKDGTSQNETAVHYRADENIYFENNLYSAH
ncbi:hepatitis A virus cellular receptor 1 homolog [Pteronotus mesoamericanus]|uniref:hepatitis A virus cellular receptor 1 homolog n=1 Tax=Pteronotus mesoamericanus TaxID=1884717 RepID=UPI0023EBF530|nr:hepatitis A virus cellular receptor 1 homolog [Pteronotus parnellii mesoamericanus]